MDNEFARKMIFAVVAFILVGLGLYATVFRTEGTQAPVDEPTAAPAPVETVAPTVEPEVTTPPEDEQEAPAADGRVKVAAPMSADDLTAAATQARDFLVQYGSFNFKQSEERQLDLLRSFISRDAQFDVTTVVPRGAVREQMVADQTVTKAEVVIEQTTLTTAQSAAFVVTLNTVTTGGDAGDASNLLTITMERSGSSWAVVAIDSGDEFGEA